jgi:hypothetical protein
MCNVYDLGSDSDLPTLGSADSKAFHVKEPNSYEIVVRRNLAFKHVRYLGSHQGCGCGFRNEINADPVSELEKAATQVDHDSLVAYLRSLPAQQRPMQILSCWSDDEELPHNTSTLTE